MRVNGEVALVAGTDPDPSFDRFVWSYEVRLATLRCLFASRREVPAKRERAILELVARINEGLTFVCAEYAFEDRIVVFRCAADLDWGPPEKVVGNATARVLKTGARYAPAIDATLRGVAPETSVKKVETAQPEVQP